MIDPLFQSCTFKRANHGQMLSQDGVSGTPRMGRIRTHNVTGDRH
jgi:hypothetical protein